MYIKVKKGVTLQKQQQNKILHNKMEASLPQRAHIQDTR